MLISLPVHPAGAFTSVRAALSDPASKEDRLDGLVKGFIPGGGP